MFKIKFYTDPNVREFYKGWIEFRGRVMCFIRSNWTLQFKW